MRRVLTSSFVLLSLATVLVATASPASAAPIRRWYQGETSDGGEFSFKTAEYADGRILVTNLELAVTITCEDGTSWDGGWGWGFGTYGPQLDGTALVFDDVSQQSATHITGDVHRRQASGTLRQTEPALTVDEQAQLCTSGDLTWEAQRVPITR